MGNTASINSVLMNTGKNAGKIALISGLLVVSSCGYKSDLFLPDEPEKLHQYDRENLQQLGEQTLQQLESRTQESDDTSDTESATVASDGVVVELPDTQDSNKRKKP
jgi:hypothetical protein